MDYTKERVIGNLESAIRVMRDACDEAERRSKSGDSSAVRRVLHAFSWGMANASTSLESALSWLEDERLSTIKE